MIEEDYVSFEIAKLLKEKGFEGRMHTFYTEEGTEMESAYVVPSNFFPIYCPTLQMAMKWLREVHNLHIQPEITAWPRKGYFVEIYLYKNRHNNFEKVPFVEHKESYEESCEAAIKYCLENLI